MSISSLQTELFSQLSEPFTGEALFDCLADLVFFIKNRRGEYVVVNWTLVERCGRREKDDLIGKRADEVFPPPLGDNFSAQDESVLRNGKAILNQLELHFHPSRGRGWCLTNKLPLFDGNRQVVGLMGISKDLQTTAAGSEGYASIAKAVHHIQQNFGAPLRVTELAKQAGMSAFQFEQRIRAAFQLTPGQFIQKTRMEAALHRLRESNDPIATIALDCGYSDQSAFTRKFRQTTGMTPSVFRERHMALAHKRPDASVGM